MSTRYALGHGILNESKYRYIMRKIYIFHKNGPQRDQLLRIGHSEAEGVGGEQTRRIGTQFPLREGSR